ncbi:MAG: hypothetical protein ACM3VX_07985 [Bacteroidota bacterium]
MRSRVWDQLSEVVAEKLRDRIECDIDVRRLADDIVEEMDVGALAEQVHESIVDRAKSGIVDTSGIVEEIVDEIVPS